MEINEKSSQKYVLWAVAIMVLGSSLLAWIMANNYSTDISKDRYRLTKIYKKIKDESYEYNSVRGKELFNQLCAKCHKPDGSGTSYYPPLQGSNLVTNNPVGTLKVILVGLRGSIERKGKQYNGSMPGFRSIPYEDIAHIVNYIRTELNQEKEFIPHTEVLKMKIDTLSQQKAYQESEL